ncbi:MAG: diguanylate cyclase [Synergistaceae bacterium]|jgi:diguanylate cyclase (GGDEF)-like protein|nr:diguanylate cyclase [Synergistaceae bacterium]
MTRFELGLRKLFKVRNVPLEKKLWIFSSICGVGAAVSLVAWSAGIGALLFLCLFAAGLGVCLALVLKMKISTTRRALEACETASAVFHGAPDAAIFFDDRFRAVDCSDAALELFEADDKERFLNEFEEIAAKMFPEFHPDGTPAPSLADRLREPGPTGRVRWITELRNRGDKTPLPVAVTLYGVPRGDSFAVVCRLTDLSSRQKPLCSSRLLLDASISKMRIGDDLLLNCLGLLSWTVGVECIHIWQKQIKRDRLICTRKYAWKKELGFLEERDPVFFHLDDAAMWTEKFMQKQYVSGSKASFSPSELRLLTPYDMKSMLLVPLFSGEIFWGFITFERREDREFSPEEIDVLSFVNSLSFSAAARDGEFSIDEGDMNCGLGQLLIERMRLDPFSSLRRWVNFYMDAVNDYESVVYNRGVGSVLRICIDSFDQIEDIWGAVGGDEAVIKVLKIVLPRLRDSDLSGHCNKKGNFCLWLPGTGLKNAVTLAQSLRKEVAKETSRIGPYASGRGRRVAKTSNIEKSLGLTISVGIASIDYDLWGNEFLDELIVRAEACLQVAQMEGGNRVRSDPFQLILERLPIVDPTFESEKVTEIEAFETR